MCGEPGDGRLAPQLQWDEARGRVVGQVYIGRAAQGPPGHAHGGSMATILDEAMGACAWLRGMTVLAVSLNINLRAMVPLESAVQVEAWVERVEGRKVHAAGRLYNASGELACESTGLFLVLPPERLGPEVVAQLQSMDTYTAWNQLGRTPPPS
jgi:acyl-coenzyme A thioesterase PaaI-like protein